MNTDYDSTAFFPDMALPISISISYDVHGVNSNSLSFDITVSTKNLKSRRVRYLLAI